MTAHTKRLDEVEKVMKYLQTAVQEVVKVVDGLESSMQTVETALADHSHKFNVLMAKLDKLASR